MRLPVLAPAEALNQVDIGLIGIPFDCATTNRPGAASGRAAYARPPRARGRAQRGTGVAPYDLVACDDLGDVR